jgi:hypothetical protein
MYPVYFRGRAYLYANKAAEAAGEFRKLLDRPGVVFVDPVGIMAQLGSIKALSMSADTAKAKKQCEEFLTRWQYADSDVPVLKEAKADCAALP